MFGLPKRCVPRSFFRELRVVVTGRRVRDMRARGTRVRGRWPNREWFASICSGHAAGKDDTCSACRCGSWVKLETGLPLLFVHDYAYPVWYWWVNRPSKRKRWLTSFEDPDTGEKQNPFPNLKL